jgi:hypothetical protein
MGRRNIKVLKDFQRLYWIQLAEASSCRQAYIRATQIWQRIHGSNCFSSYESFKSSISRANKLQKVKI